MEVVPGDIDYKIKEDDEESNKRVKNSRHSDSSSPSQTNHETINEDDNNENRDKNF
jgi:hypothetical protein